MKCFSCKGLASEKLKGSANYGLCLKCNEKYPVAMIEGSTKPKKVFQELITFETILGLDCFVHIHRQNTIIPRYTPIEYWQVCKEAIN